MACHFGSGDAVECLLIAGAYDREHTEIARALISAIFGDNAAILKLLFEPKIKPFFE
jgi:hypothetical protein